MSDPTPGFVIRDAYPRDAAAVLVCLTAAFEVYRESYTPDAFADTVLTKRSAERRFREMTVLLAENDAGEVVGTAAFKVLASGEGHLRGMAVHPRFQDQGVGEKLLSAAEHGLRECGCSRVSLDTTSPLKKAIAFYRRHGYEPTGVVNDFFGMLLFEYAKSLE